MAKKKHVFQSTVPTVVVALVGAVALGVFLHFYTGGKESSVLGAQTGEVRSERTVLLGWLRGLFTKKSVPPQSPASGYGSTMPPSYGETAKPVPTKRTSPNTGSSVKTMPPVATTDDDIILQDINSVVTDDGGVNDFKELDTMK